MPTTAEELMRSRFTAYCLKRVDYLVDTTHPDSRGPGLRRGIEETAAAIQWTSLKVVSTNQGGASDKMGKVEFIAEYLLDGQARQHHERSRFRRFKGGWKYLDDRG